MASGAGGKGSSFLPIPALVWKKKNPRGRTRTALAWIMGIFLHQSLGAEVGHSDWPSSWQMPIPQPVIVAREVKSYKHKAAQIWAPWLCQEEVEGRIVWFPQRRISRIAVVTRAIIYELHSHFNWSLLWKWSEKSIEWYNSAVQILLLWKILILGPEDLASSRDSCGRDVDKLYYKSTKESNCGGRKMFIIQIPGPIPRDSVIFGAQEFIFLKPLPQGNLDIPGSQSILWETLVQNLIWHQNPRWDAWPGSKESESRHSRQVPSFTSYLSLFLLFQLQVEKTTFSFPIL